MFNKDLYKDEVLKKYLSVSKNRNDDFYNKKIYKNNTINSQIHTLFSTIVIFISFGSMVFAGYEVHNYFMSEKQPVTNTPSSIDYAFYMDMEQEKGIYYKKINNYEEYKKYKEMWPNLLEMSKVDFQDNIIIITAAENSDTINLEISDIYTDNDNIYIEFYETNNTYDSSVVIGTKINKELDRENIKIRYKKDIAIENDKFVKITDIPSNYSKDNAIKDGCIVIQDNKILSNNFNDLEEFVNNCKKGVEGCIRIYGIIPEGIIIKDIQFSNNKYKFNSVNLNDITDIRSQEYIDIQFKKFKMGEMEYKSLEMTNDINKIEWDMIAIITD